MARPPANEPICVRPQILGDFFQVPCLGGAVGALVGPVCDLEAQEYAQNQDHQLDQDSGPLLLLQMVRDTTKDHSSPR